MGGSPKIPPVTQPPPPPQPAQLSLAPPKNKMPNLGGTYLTGGAPLSAPQTAGKKTLFGQ